MNLNREPLEPSPALEVVERLIENMTGGCHAECVEALRQVVSALGAEGGMVMALTEFETPRPLFSYGELKGNALWQEVYDLFGDPERKGDAAGEYQNAVIKDGVSFACASLARPKCEALGIILWSSAATRFPHPRLLNIFLQLLSITHRDRGGLKKRAETQNQFKAKEYPSGYIEGKSEAMKVLHRELDLLSAGNWPVLILGETGVGKEYIARIIHSWSDRNHGPFIAVNCSAIPNELWEAEMFGIGKGVATGVRERDGYFQHAHGGTLFLDEIGDMLLTQQPKLLRVLQDCIIHRVGANDAKVDVRIITATNTNLLGRVEERSFRSDLYYRIAGIVLNVPRLQDRKDDIPMLVHNFVEKYAREARKTVGGIDGEVFELLHQYGWPGNIRELEHEIRRLVYFCQDGGVIDSAMLSSHIVGRQKVQADNYWNPQLSLNLDSHVEELERKLITEALSRTYNNRTRAAQLLGLSRNGLAIKIQRLGIGNPDVLPFCKTERRERTTYVRGLFQPSRQGIND